MPKWKQKLVLVIILGALTTLASIQLFRHRHYRLPIVAGDGVTKVGLLSEYAPSLKGTMADTHVFYLEGREPGATAVLIANTHSNEPAAILSAMIFLEHAVVEKGNLIIIPQFNNSGSRNTRPGDGYPLYFSIPTSWGKKTFRMGNRDASPLDQWPDPDLYIHYPERQLLSYLDIRNTNRTWPGRPNGSLMERVTYAAMEIIRSSGAAIAIDIHGAETMFPVTNCIVASEKSMRIATMATLTVKAKEKFDNHVEPSPSGFRGLSHREIGDYSDAMPFLLEAPIPFLDQPTGPKTEKLMLDGKDPFLLKLAEKGKLFVPYDEEGWPMEKRVGQHCSVIQEIFRQYTRRNRDKPLVITNVPQYAEVVAKGVGYFFSDPSKVDKKKVYFN
jgi:predicted deacylase